MALSFLTSSGDFSMIISTVSRRVRGRVKELAARCIDVTPGVGETEFSLPYDLWHSFEVRTRFTDDWDDLFELAMWQLSIKYPINWLKMLQSSHIVLIDKEPYALGGKDTARAKTALALYKVLKQKGFKVQLGYEYADERKRA